MKISPVIRVIISNTAIIGALVAVWFGYGPFFLIAALAAYVYLHRIMTPRIPAFNNRGHSFKVRSIWTLLVVSMAGMYFAVDGGWMSRHYFRVYACITVPLLFGGSFFDDVRYARKMQFESKPAA